MIRSRKVLDHARGQPCQLALPGICSHDPATTVFAHLNGSAFGKGAGMKAHDIAGCFADYSCHTYLDTGHGTNPQMTDLELSQALLKAVVGTWVILVQDGIIVVPMDAPKPPKAITRKPAGQRAKIASGPTNWPKRAFPQRVKAREANEKD